MPRLHSTSPFIVPNLTVHVAPLLPSPPYTPHQSYEISPTLYLRKQIQRGGIWSLRIRCYCRCACGTRACWRRRDRCSARRRTARYRSWNFRSFRYPLHSTHTNRTTIRTARPTPPLLSISIFPLHASSHTVLRVCSSTVTQPHFHIPIVTSPSRNNDLFKNIAKTQRAPEISYQPS